MYPRIEYEMTGDDMETLLDSCKPTPAMFLSGGVPMGGTPQENANRAWKALGRKMGFDSNTVQPIDGKGQRFFSAIPSENEEVRKERLVREVEEKRQGDIRRLTEEISDRIKQIEALESNAE